MAAEGGGVESDSDGGDSDSGLATLSGKSPRAKASLDDGELEEEGPQLRYQSAEPRPADSPSASC